VAGCGVVGWAPVPRTGCESLGCHENVSNVSRSPPTVAQLGVTGRMRSAHMPTAKKIVGWSLIPSGTAGTTASLKALPSVHPAIDGNSSLFVTWLASASPFVGEPARPAVGRWRPRAVSRAR
jgi:hypothetical protein